MGSRFDPFRSLGGYYQTLLLYHFFDSGLFDLLRKPITPELAARQMGWRKNELTLCLDFLRLTTGLVDRDRRGRFRVTNSEAADTNLRFQLTKFTRAYGPAAEKLPIALQDPNKGRALVNRRALANAFYGVKDSSRSWIFPMLLGAGVSSLLDLGCGTASLLVELAKRDDNFHGIGVENDRQMCKMARANTRSHGVSRRVRIIQADAREVNALPDAETIYAASLMNEFFGVGTNAAVRFLTGLKEKYPRRDCWFMDYYGVLGQISAPANSLEVSHAMLHDLVQVLSGQGVPPANLRAWRAIYRSARVQLIESHEFHERGLSWFIHRVRL